MHTLKDCRHCPHQYAVFLYGTGRNIVRHGCKHPHGSSDNVPARIIATAEIGDAMTAWTGCPLADPLDAFLEEVASNTDNLVQASQVTDE